MFRLDFGACALDEGCYLAACSAFFEAQAGGRTLKLLYPTHDPQISVLRALYSGKLGNFAQVTPPPLNLKELCTRIAQEIENEINRYPLDQREDSRAFGASIESIIKNKWESLCSRLGLRPLGHGGARTIYDVAFEYKGYSFGMDIRSKDTDPRKYSDGGVCSIGNLLKFLEKKWFLLVAEIEHLPNAQDRTKREVKGVLVFPFHCLPMDIYRIQNLGTGQMRFNGTISNAYERMEWHRTVGQFLDILLTKARDHYTKVAEDAVKRREKVEKDIQRIKHVWS